MSSFCPLAGYLYGNHKKLLILRKLPILNFCPLPGRYVSIYQQRRRDGLRRVLVPSRDYLYLNFWQPSENMRQSCSRPLSGPSISQFVEPQVKARLIKSSRPLSGPSISQFLSPAPPVNAGLKLRFAAQTEMGCPVSPFCSPQPSFSRYLQSAAENQVLRSFIP